jgi:hypothetical protein
VKTSSIDQVLRVALLSLALFAPIAQAERVKEHA